MTATATRLGADQRSAVANSDVPRSRLRAWVARPMSMITPREMAKTGPPAPYTVEIDAAMGTLATVATRNSRRTVRPLPDTALADHVSCCHGNHRRKKTRVTRPTPPQLGSTMSRPTSWEKANT